MGKNYTSVEKIAHVRLLCHHVLPAVYDESLSYLEGLAKLTFKVNESIKAVNALNDNVDVLNDSVTELNDRVTTVEGEIDGFEKEVTKRVAQLEWELKETINQSINDMENRVDASIADLNTRMTELENYVSSTVDGLVKEVKDLIAEELEKIQLLYDSLEVELRQYVEDTVNQLIADIPDLTTIYVTDPTTGRVTKVEDALKHVFEANLDYALTVDEFNALGLTCVQLNDLVVHGVVRGMTCSEWLLEAKKILEDYVPLSIAKEWVDPHLIDKNVLTGSDCWIEDAIHINTSMWAWSGCFTCDEIVTNNFNCDTIIGFNISCEDYVLRANEIMVA